MQVTITAVGPDHKGLADPIIHYVTGAGATSMKFRCTTVTPNDSLQC